MMQLNRIRNIEARLRLVTGLHIGAGNDEMHIGGIDMPVVKHPLTGEPYIPGSSLKVKMRSLLEWRAGVDSGQWKDVTGPLAMSDADYGREVVQRTMFYTAPEVARSQDKPR